MNISVDFKKGYPWMEIEIQNNDTTIRVDVHEEEIEDIIYQVNELLLELFDKTVEMNIDKIYKPLKLQRVKVSELISLTAYSMGVYK